MIAVVDTGPLISLTRLGRLRLLTAFYDAVVPDAVVEEIEQRDDDVRIAVLEALDTWLRRETLHDISLYDALRHELGPGESAVIAAAISLRIQVVLLDDQDARRMARLYGLNPIGTLGLLLRAKKQGELPAVRPEIEKLERLGFYASQSLIEAILAAANEE